MTKKEIQALKQATGKKMLPILSQVRVVGGEAMATDLEVSLTIKCDVPDGMYAISPKFELVKTSWDVADFPELDTQEFGNSVGVDMKAMGELVPLISKDQTRPALTFIRVSEGWAMATDGYVAGKRGHAGDFWLSKKAYQLMKKLGGTWSVRTNEQTLLFESESAQIRMNRPYETFPKILGMFTVDRAKRVVIDNLKKGERFSLDQTFTGIEVGDNHWEATVRYEAEDTAKIRYGWVDCDFIIMPMAAEKSDMIGYLDGEKMAQFKSKEVELAIPKKLAPVGVKLI